MFKFSKKKNSKIRSSAANVSSNIINRNNPTKIDKIINAFNVLSINADRKIEEAVRLVLGSVRI